MDIDYRAPGDFSRAVRKGFWHKVSSWLTGENIDLLPFDEIKQRFSLQGQSYLGLQVVRIDDIAGSMGRYRDFDRAFLPRQTRTRDRWISIDSAHYEDIPLPPVELYKISDIYIVKDGNHRVSVARERGQELIDAFVTEILIPVHLSPDIGPDELRLKQEYAKFLEHTRINEIRPGAEIELTLEGEYDRLLEHINTHRWYLGEQKGEEVTFEGAVASWYDNVYQPLVEIVRQVNLLDAFPGRTEADLYLWIVEYQWYRREAYKEHFSIAEAAMEFAETYDRWPVKKLVKALSDSAWVDNLILLQEKTGFLERSRLQEKRPDAEIELTQPGQYEKLLDHISVHRWYLGEETGREASFEDAASSWYDHVYLPLVQIIRDQQILDQFPGRTETDLYLWILEHRAHLAEILGWEVAPRTAATDLAEQYRSQDGSAAQDDLDPKLKLAFSGEARTAPPARGQLFVEILVALSGEETSWRALEQGIVIAQREGSRVHGYHVTPTAEDHDPVDIHSLEERFIVRCLEAGVQADFVVAEGNPAYKINERARWTDLVVIPLNHPPGTSPLAKMSSGLRQLIRQSSRPILTVPGMPTKLEAPLLAYDGSRNADGALFIAASVARRWDLSLMVVTVRETSINSDVADIARRYLEKHAVQATFIVEDGPVAPTILETARHHDRDWILLGGYGRHLVLEIVLGSSIDQILLESDLPTLICK